MTKTSTIHFTINDLASQTNPKIQDVNSALDFEEEFEDVLSKLDELDIDVRQEVVNRIIDLASEM